MSRTEFVDHLKNGDIEITVSRLPDGSLVHCVAAGAGYLEFPEAQWRQLVDLITAVVDEKKSSTYRSIHGRLFGRKH